ncbi:COPII coat GTPase [Dissophora globulifera]|nr:COPII coat GTPase [Dissophora globulifera]
MFLGLDSAGKSTLLHVLKHGRSATLTPTIHPTLEEVYIANVKFSIIDLGDQHSSRLAFQQYFSDLDAIVFLIDSQDRDRFSESKVDLDALLADQRLEGKPLLILGNKIDASGAVSEEELRSALGLTQTTGKGIVPLTDMRPLEVFMCSAILKQGYEEGMHF